MYRFAIAALTAVLALGLAQAQTRKNELRPTPSVCPAPANGGPGVAVEVHVLRISDGLMAELTKQERTGLWIDLNNLRTIDGDKRKAILDRVFTDIDSEVLAAPKIMSLSGQEARISIGNELPFVLGLNVVQMGDQSVFVPHNQTLCNGCCITLTPTITPDNGHVLMRFKAEQSELPDTKVPLFPVTTFITPEFEDGVLGQPIPFTQFIQQPTQIKRSVTNAFGVANGQTQLIYGGHTVRTDKQVERVPFFADLPIIGDLFEKETDKHVSNHLVYMVTPQIVAAPPAPCNNLGCRLPPMPSMMPTAAPLRVVMAANGSFPCAPPMPPTLAPIAPGECVVFAPAPAPCKLPSNVPCVESERKVSMCCSIIKVDDAFFSRADAKAWADLAPKEGFEPGRLIAADTAERFCLAVKAQNGGEIVSQPILTSIDGVALSFATVNEDADIMNIGFEDRDGVTVPTFHKLNGCGLKMELLPTLAKDGKSCRLAMTIDHTKRSANLPIPCEVTIKTPATGDLPEVIRTEMVRASMGLSQRCINTLQDVPCGRCVLIYVNKEETDAGIKHLAILVTPTALDRANDKPMPTAMPTPMLLRTCDKDNNCVYPYPVSALEERMARYRKACAEERWADARRLAAECLELDPKCFLPK